MSYDLKQVIVIRRDLKMRQGKAVSQGSHSSGEFMKEQLLAIVDGGELTLTADEITWMRTGMAKITVRADTEDEFYRVRDEALALGLKVRLITDSGLTEFKNVPTVTALAIGPDRVETIDKVTGGMTLL